LLLIGIAISKLIAKINNEVWQLDLMEFNNLNYRYIVNHFRVLAETKLLATLHGSSEKNLGFSRHISQSPNMQ